LCSGLTACHVSRSCPVARTAILHIFDLSSIDGEDLRNTALSRPFAEWGKVFHDQASSPPSDRLVSHSTVPEMNVESYRRRAALNRKRGPGRPAVHGTIKEGAAGHWWRPAYFRAYA
jgi:hypothetical protein